MLTLPSFIQQRLLMFSAPAVYTGVSLAVKRTDSQTSNTGYAFRGMKRTQEAPSDRKADNNFRDYQMTFVTNTLTEIGFRGVQSWYVVPRMTEALELHRLSEIYGERYPGLAVKNYKQMPDIIRQRMMGTLVRDKSVAQVPDLLENLEAQFLAKKGSELSAEDKAQLRILLEHLHKNLNFKDYLEDQVLRSSKGEVTDPLRQLTQAEADFILKQRQRIMDLHGVALLSKFPEITKAKPEERAKLLSKLPALVEEVAKATKTLGTPEDIANLEKLQVESRLQSLMNHSPSKNFFKDAHKKEINNLKWELKEHFDQVVQNQKAHQSRLEKTLDWAKALPEQDLTDAAKKKLMYLIEDGVKGDRVFNALKHIQKNGGWPQTFCSVILTFVTYGLVANLFDVKVLQPWQDRLVKERGSSEAYVKPSYWATPVGLAALVYGMQNKWQFNAIRKLSYFNRFLFAGVGALGVYTASFLLLLKRELSKPVPPQQKAMAQPNPQPFVVKPPVPPAMPSVSPAASPFQSFAQAGQSV